MNTLLTWTALLLVVREGLGELTELDFHFCFGSIASAELSVRPSCEGVDIQNGTLIRQGFNTQSRKVVLPKYADVPFFVMCSSKEPIRMRLNFPKHQVQLQHKGRPAVSDLTLKDRSLKGGYVSETGDGETFIYHQWIEFSKLSRLHGEVRCEKIERPQEWTQLFIEPSDAFEDVHTPLMFDVATNHHFFIPELEELEGEDSAVIPCIGLNPTAQFTSVDLYKRPLSFNLFVENDPETEHCVELICKALSMDVQGSGKLAGFLGNNGTYGEACLHPTRKYAMEDLPDCTKDGLISCPDVFVYSVKVLHPICSTPQNSYDEFLAHLQSLLNVASIRPRPIHRVELITHATNYNIDKGFIINQPVDYMSEYICSTMRSKEEPFPIAPSFIPLRQENKIESVIRIAGPLLTGVRCDVNRDAISGKRDFQLWMTECSSVNDCELYFRKQLALGQPTFENEFIYGTTMETYGDIRSKIIAQPFAYGVVGCTGIFIPVPYGPPTYIQAFDFLFRGFDDHLHFASESLPDGSAVKITSEAGLIPGRAQSFKCVISTFILYPVFKFVARAENETRQVVLSTMKAHGVQNGKWSFSEVSRNLGMKTANIKLTIVLSDDISSVECSAPRIDAVKWEKDTLSKSGNSGHLPVPVLIAVIFLSVLFLVLLSGVILLLIINLRANARELNERHAY